MKKIINKYYCDRCGNEIPYKPRGHYMGSIKGTQDVATLYAELCKECEKSFEKWWKQKGEE